MAAIADRRRASLRHLLGTLAVIQLCLTTIGVVSWLRSYDRTSAPEERPTALDVATRPTSLESAWPVARRAADRWRTNAFPVSESLQVDWPWEVGPDPQPSADGGFATFVFASGAPLGDPATFSVVVERLSGLVVRRDERRWSDGLPPAIGTEPTAVDSLAALDIAEHVGGTAFRRACPSQRHETRVTRVPAFDSPRVWLVSYLDGREPTTNALDLRIDAKTGELLDHIDRSTPCDVATAVAG